MNEIYKHFVLGNYQEQYTHLFCYEADSVYPDIYSLEEYANLSFEEKDKYAQIIAATEIDCD